MSRNTAAGLCRSWHIGGNACKRTPRKRVACGVWHVERTCVPASGHWWTHAVGYGSFIRIVHSALYTISLFSMEMQSLSYLTGPCYGTKTQLCFIGIMRKALSAISEFSMEFYQRYFETLKTSMMKCKRFKTQGKLKS